MPEDGDGFQGESSNDVEYLQDMDLFALSEQTKHLWRSEERTPLHRALEILIRQNMNWTNGDNIMKRIRDSIGSADMSASNMIMTDKTLKKWGLSAEKISGIRKILSLGEITPKTLCSVKEGGIHLIQMFTVMEGENDDCWIYNDSNILRNLGTLLGRSRSLTPREGMIVSRASFAGVKSQISYFLHMLRPEGAIAICNDEPLEVAHFYSVN
jgi:hypothetical protein